MSNLNKRIEKIEAALPAERPMFVSMTSAEYDAMTLEEIERRFKDTKIYIDCSPDEW